MFDDYPLWWLHWQPSWTLLRVASDDDDGGGDDGGGGGDDDGGAADDGGVADDGVAADDAGAAASDTADTSDTSDTSEADAESARESARGEALGGLGGAGAGAGGGAAGAGGGAFGGDARDTAHYGDGAGGGGFGGGDPGGGDPGAGDPGEAGREAARGEALGGLGGGGTAPGDGGGTFGGDARDTSAYGGGTAPGDGGATFGGDARDTAGYTDPGRIDDPGAAAGAPGFRSEAAAAAGGAPGGLRDIGAGPEAGAVAQAARAAGVGTGGEQSVRDLLSGDTPVSATLASARPGEEDPGNRPSAPDISGNIPGQTGTGFATGFGLGDTLQQNAPPSDTFEGQLYTLPGANPFDPGDPAYAPTPDAAPATPPTPGRGPGPNASGWIDVQGQEPASGFDIGSLLGVSQAQAAEADPVFGAQPTQEQINAQIAAGVQGPVSRNALATGEAFNPAFTDAQGQTLDFVQSLGGRQGVLAGDAAAAAASGMPAWAGTVEGLTDRPTPTGTASQAEGQLLGRGPVTGFTAGQPDGPPVASNDQESPLDTAQYPTGPIGAPNTQVASADPVAAVAPDFQGDLTQEQMTAYLSGQVPGQQAPIKLGDFAAAAPPTLAEAPSRPPASIGSPAYAGLQGGGPPAVLDVPTGQNTILTQRTPGPAPTGPPSGFGAGTTILPSGTFGAPPDTTTPPAPPDVPTPPTPAPPDRIAGPAAPTPAPGGGGGAVTPDAAAVLAGADGVGLTDGGGGDGGGGLASTGTLTPRNIINPIPSPDGGPPPADGGFTPPPPQPLEDINFGNINPEAGIFGNFLGPGGVGDGTGGLPGGVPGPLPPAAQAALANPLLGPINDRNSAGGQVVDTGSTAPVDINAPDVTAALG
jgi:hypothetical protein